MRRALALLLLAPACAQVLQQDRRDYGTILQLRRELLAPCLTASEGSRADVARLLARPSDGQPLQALARARARLLGVEPDTPYLWRASLQCLAMPEIVDLEGYTKVAVTVHAPRVLPDAGKGTFHVRLLDREGKERASASITTDCGNEDLLRYRASVELDVGELPDGTYTAEVLGLLDEQPPRAHDARPRATFHVLRGWKRRYDGLVDQLRRRGSEVVPGDLALLQGLLAPLQRVHEGEPNEGGDALQDWITAEQAYHNWRSGRPLLEGLAGWTPIAVRDGKALALLRVRLPARAGQPLVLFVPGSPAIETDGRPMSPSITGPDDLAAILQTTGFDREREWLLAVLESPGRQESMPSLIAVAAKELRARFSTSGLALVGEREGAVAASLALDKVGEELKALALVCGGALGPGSEHGRRLPITLVPGTDHPSTENLRRIQGERVRRLEEAARPWPLALPLAAADLQRSLRESLGR